ncbi:Zinc uptake regulation protein [Roseobacter fucihabitans]|uniref:Zinc uptake regulation protein n=1 Tax=Roseobacter fucihabitans TaxID=1537242 RepID=A0ABZ2BRP9_9RHOB|nr:transcriptional repressor [Roseobacter litoralis]MBC6964365.1 Zinc uptake regulation protein [Roseobacter litoralis]
MSALGFCAHDHDTCVTDMMALAHEICAQEGLNFTPVRQRALQILLREHRALGAYELLAQLSKDGHGAHQPPVAYRALDFLVKAGLAHKIEALNAYVACTQARTAHTPAFLICRTCNAVAEADTGLASGRLGEAARAAGFAIEHTVVEAQGLCPACQEPAP